MTSAEIVGIATDYEKDYTAGRLQGDGLALLAWVRKLPWYNGEIFLEGGSYLTSVHWSYLDTNPPDVKGACLSIQEVDRYDIAYRNGFFKAGLHGGWFIKGYKKKNHALQRNASVSFSDFPLLDFYLLSGTRAKEGRFTDLLDEAFCR